MRGKLVEIICKCGCGRKKLVREADVKRGWGKYFDKSCKAKHQESKTGQYSKFLKKSLRSENMTDDEYYIAVTHPFDSDALGQD